MPVYGDDNSNILVLLGCYALTFLNVGIFLRFFLGFFHRSAVGYEGLSAERRFSGFPRFKTLFREMSEI